MNVPALPVVAVISLHVFPAAGGAGVGVPGLAARLAASPRGLGALDDARDGGVGEDGVGVVLCVVGVVRGGGPCGEARVVIVVDGVHVVDGLYGTRQDG
jgi:hypothetical protein